MMAIWWRREEKGTYYGINLRGTNFVIVRAKLGGRNEALTDLLRQEVEIPSHILDSTSVRACNCKPCY